MPNISLIIPTYNRPKYLKRLLGYLSESRVNYKIIVADSSSDENKKINSQNIASLVDLNVLHLKNFSQSTRPFEKMSEASSFATSKYAVLCADDDFLTPEGINRSAEFLENNPDFSVAHGYYITFLIKAGKFFWKVCFSEKSVEDGDPKERFRKQLGGYSLPTMYGVHRADLLKMILKNAADYTDDDRFGELLPSVISLIYGKMKHLDIFYGARETISNSTGRTSKSIQDFRRIGSFEYKYSRFKRCLLSHSVPESLIDSAMSSYLKEDYRNNFMDYISRGLKMANAKEDAYWKISSFLKSIYTKLVLLGKNDYMDSLDFPLENREDFLKVRERVLLCR